MSPTDDILQGARAALEHARRRHEHDHAALLTAAEDARAVVRWTQDASQFGLRAMDNERYGLKAGSLRDEPGKHPEHWAEVWLDADGRIVLLRTRGNGRVTEDDFRFYGDALVDSIRFGLMERPQLGFVARAILGPDGQVLHWLQNGGWMGWRWEHYEHEAGRLVMCEEYLEVVDASQVSGVAPGEVAHWQVKYEYDRRGLRCTRRTGPGGWDDDVDYKRTGADLREAITRGRTAIGDWLDRQTIDEDGIRALLEKHGATDSQARRIVDALRSGGYAPRAMRSWLSETILADPSTVALFGVELVRSPLGALQAGQAQLVVKAAQSAGA